MTAPVPPSGPVPTPAPLTRRKSPKKKAPVKSLTRTGKFDWCEQQIVEHLCKPWIDHILHQGCSSLQDLTNKFRAKTGSGVSPESMKEWLAILGYQLQKPVMLSVTTQPVAAPPAGSPAAVPASPPVGAPPSEEPTDPTIRFANEDRANSPGPLVVGPTTAPQKAAMEATVGFAPDFRMR